jgi:hypothetical protein
MRAALLALAVVVVVLAGGGWLLSSPPGAVQPLAGPTMPIAAPRGGSAGDITSFVVPGDGRNHLVVMDARQHVLCVYHVDGTSGEISLKSVRNFHQDLAIEDYNGAAPTPRDIRALLAPR